MVKLFKWGDDNDIVIFIRRFKQYAKNCKDFTRYFEVEFLEVCKGNNPHRTSRGKGETLGEAMDKVWKHYKRKD